MSTYERLRTILATEYKVADDRLAPEAELEALGLDSLAVMELLFKVEDDFQVRVPSEQVELKTIADVVAFIDRLTTEQSPPPGAAATASGGGHPAAP